MSDSSETAASESPVPASAAESSLRPPGTGRKTYAERVAERMARRAAAQDTAARICVQLNEPNVAAVARLVDLFGPELIEAQAAQVQQLIATAASGTPPHPVLQTRTGQPRTPGGVLFQLMQEHATGLGLHWAALALPLPPPKRGTRNAEGGTWLEPESPPPGPARPTTRPAPVTPLATPAAVGPAVPSSSEPAPAPAASGPGPAVRPARAKLTVVGSLAGPPRDIAGPQGPLVELPFHCEMTPTLPKGLPVLGPTLVVVWCTPKQWAKVRDGLTGMTRLIAEGEAALAQDASGVPLLRLVCLNLRTLEAAAAG